MTSKSHSNLPHNCHDIPSPSQLAFAFAILASKPPHVSIQDYIESLRSAIVTQPQKHSSDLLDFDADMYWKASYQRAESERLRLLNEITRLKEERDSLQSREESPQLSRPTLGKRKRDSIVQRTRKKAGRQPHDTPQKTNADMNDDDVIDLDNARINGPGTNLQAFLRGFMSLRRSLLLAEPDKEKIANAIQLTSIPISKILLQSMQATQKRDGEPEGLSVAKICMAFKRVYPSVLDGLQLLVRQTSRTTDQHIPAITEVVKVFQAFLGRLHKFALDECARREHETRSKKQAVGPTSEEDITKAREITRTLLKMFTAIDVTKNAHCRLLEGYLCALLDHVGSSLSLLVFADSTGSRKRQQRGILPPSGLLDSAHLQIESAKSAATLEGPYVCFILRKGLEFLLENADRMSEESLAKFTLYVSDENGAATENNLRHRIEKTLQSTLLRGAFGDDDDMFSNSLRRDDDDEEEVSLEPMMKARNSKEEEPSAEWFIGELWETLGWDILSGGCGI